jgi:RNA-directed DNA polymerase
MQEQIREAIVRKARAVLRKQRIDAAQQWKYAERYQKRTGAVAGAPDTSDPSWWSLHPHYDPRYCITHAKYLSRVIWTKVQRGTYEPVPAIQFDVPKPDGSSRQIMAFTIPDSALANLVHQNATKRNINIFSSYNFAYRTDKNVFDAILNLRRALRGPKVYIIQYDFSKYFDTIDHAFLRRLLFDRKLFLLSQAERNIIDAFLEHTYQKVSEYDSGLFDVRETGVPQGSSLSLFLSNAAAHDLDLSLERQNGSFVRFADDVVAITHSYRDALDVADQFRAHCKDAGLRINYDKSPGILIFGGGPDVEKREFVIDTDDVSSVETIRHIDYLGHQITDSHVLIPDKSIKRIKRRISEIVYKHLFLHRKGAGGLFNPARIGHGFVDWDLVTCINEVRTYIYGGLRESQVSAFIESNTKLPHVRGLMGFLPLVTSIGQLKVLDGWLLNIFMRAQRERVKVLSAHGHVVDRLTKSQMRQGTWYRFDPIQQDMTLPSFVRSWRAARKYYRRYGLKGIQPPSYYSLIGYS